MLHSVLMTFSRPSVAAILLLLLGITHPDVIYQASAADEDREGSRKTRYGNGQIQFCSKKWLPAELQNFKGYKKTRRFQNIHITLYIDRLAISRQCI